MKGWCRHIGLPTWYTNLCLEYLLHKWYSFWWIYQKISSEYWKGIARPTVSRNLNSMYCILFERRGLKSSKFYEECISSFSASATEKFCSFWKPISPRILHPKSQKLHQLLSFTSSLNCCSQFVSSVIPSPCKVVC